MGTDQPDHRRMGHYRQDSWAAEDRFGPDDVEWYNAYLETPESGSRKIVTRIQKTVGTGKDSLKRILRIYKAVSHGLRYGHRPVRCEVPICKRGWIHFGSYYARI